MVTLPGQRRRLQEKVDAVPFWWHSIDLGHGVVTPGPQARRRAARELDAMALPDLTGKSVLDIGGWDGYFAFEAERRGAARVAVVDHYMWSMDAPGQQAYWRRCMEDGVAPRPYHETEFWHPDTLPGKRGFDLAREALGSAVEPIVADFMTCDLAALGRWDVVLYLGVLYHMEEPLTALRRVASSPASWRSSRPRRSSCRASSTRRCGACFRAPSSTATSRTGGRRTSRACSGRCARRGLRRRGRRSGRRRADRGAGRAASLPADGARFEVGVCWLARGRLS